ncbi:MAG: phosphoribosylglycinamide formyltransferase [Sphingobacteriia bacterium]|nr:phosphoribosylglycinamide formyltransferase [Sphingobacteriia bacterium]
MTRIAIFASGNGTNAERIAAYFSGHSQIRIALILSNRKDAYVLKRAENLGIPSKVFNRKMFCQTHEVIQWLKDSSIHFIVLAGFLWLVPPEILNVYRGRIINIHPALLPDFGGKGMFGDAVHKAVLKAGVQTSGITIHYVDENYDHGNIIFQATCNVDIDDTPESLAEKIHQLEYKYYPVVIENIINGKPDEIRRMEEKAKYKINLRKNDYD